MSGRARLGALAATLLLTPAAPAYIPSVGSLLRKAAARIAEGGRTRDVTFTGTLEVGRAADPRTLSVRFPLSCRFENGAAVRGTAAQPLGSSSGGTGAEKDLLELACPLIAYRGLSLADAEKALRATATAAGADLTAATALARLADRVAVVLGAPARQLDRPQLWLYKDTAAPARLIARRDGHLQDLRLLEYGNPASADWFPRILELYQDGAPVARFEVVETKGFRETTEEEDDDRE